MAAFLVPMQPGACVIPLEKAVLLIGRQADCDVSLTTSRKISRKHCCIAIVNDAVVVRDLGSTNGVSINGQRIDREGRIRLGDELTIGDVCFRLQRDAQPPPSASPTPEQIPNRDRSQTRPRSTLPEAAPPPSLDFPVALVEESHDFAVESSIIRRKPLSTAKKTESSDSGPLLPYRALEDDDDEIPGLLDDRE